MSPQTQSDGVVGEWGKGWKMIMHPSYTNFSRRPHFFNARPFPFKQTTDHWLWKNLPSTPTVRSRSTSL